MQKYISRYIEHCPNSVTRRVVALPVSQTWPTELMSTFNALHMGTAIIFLNRPLASSARAQLCRLLHCCKRRILLPLPPFNIFSPLRPLSLCYLRHQRFLLSSSPPPFFLMVLPLPILLLPFIYLIQLSSKLLIPLKLQPPCICFLLFFIDCAFEPVRVLEHGVVFVACETIVPGNGMPETRAEAAFVAADDGLCYAALVELAGVAFPAPDEVRVLFDYIAAR